MANAVETALQELREQLELVGPIREGLEDFRRLNLETEAKAEIIEQIRFYQDRITLINAAVLALEALLNDNYPMLEVRELSPAVLEELKANMETLAAAFATFSQEEAASLGLRSEPPQPK